MKLKLLSCIGVGLLLSLAVAGEGTGRHEASWSVMHPTAIDTNYMARVVGKAVEYGGVDSFEVCGLEQRGINALSLFERYPHVRVRVDEAFVIQTRDALNDVTSPRPYSRLNLIAGTKGVLRGYPRLEICLEGRDEWPKKDGHHVFNERTTKEMHEKYMHPLQKALGEIAQKAGGHGGMDFMMDLRWAYCLQKGLPLDMDVYDLASWCAVCELSERSARNRSASVDFPDFTRGVWKTKCNSNLMDAEMDASNLDFGTVGKIDGQMNI